MTDLSLFRKLNMMEKRPSVWFWSCTLGMLPPHLTWGPPGPHYPFQPTALSPLWAGSLSCWKQSDKSDLPGRRLSSVILYPRKQSLCNAAWTEQSSSGPVVQWLTCGLIEMLSGRLKEGSRGKEESKGQQIKGISAEYASVRRISDCRCELIPDCNNSYNGRED